MGKPAAYYTELFARLGGLLEGFGTVPETRAVAEAAVAANPWFTLSDVVFSVDAVRRNMLDAAVSARWLSYYGANGRTVRSRVAVIMAGNIPLVGLSDLLCVVASDCIPYIKMSSKDSVLMEYVVGLLCGLAPGIRVERYVPEERYDAAIATGSDNANRYFRAQYAGIPSLLRGNRQSVAVLGGRETPAQLTALADDIWAYSGLGCRSVSLLFLPEGYDLQLRMPEVNVKYRNSYRQQKALLTMGGQPFRDLGAAVAVEERAFPAVLSRINYSFYKSPAEVGAWLAEHDAGLQCVVSECIACRRRVDFGHAQSPGLTDYPDDRDVIEFLTTSCL